jgi:two-component system, NtrC family, sensor kinase
MASPEAQKSPLAACAQAPPPLSTAPPVTSATLTQENVERFVQIAKGKAEWEQTVDAIDDPIALQDGYQVRRANRSLAQIGGVEVRNLPGRTCHELLAGRSSPCPGCPLAAEKRPTGPATGEITTDTGSTFVVSLFPLVGRADGWVVRHRDVTQEREALSTAREHERMAAVGRLAAGAAHEINNPLSFLISNMASLGRDLERIDVLAQALRHVLELLDVRADQAALDTLKRFRGSPHLEALEVLGEDGPERIAEALVGANRVAAIVRAMRSLATERVGELSAVDAGDSVDRALRRLGDEQPPLEQHPIEWTSREDLPVCGQPQGLDEALYQVLRNAFQFSAVGAQVTLSAQRSAGNAIIRVQDHGAGIPAKVLDRVFEPFFTTRPPGDGLGLGLTIAYGIVRQHGGRIQVHTVGGAGTCVEISLPLRAASTVAASDGLDPFERDGAAT